MFSVCTVVWFLVGMMSSQKPCQDQILQLSWVCRGCCTILVETDEQLGVEGFDVASSSEGADFVGGVFLVPKAPRVHANFDWFSVWSCLR